jgi:hypothetical protein
MDTNKNNKTILNRLDSVELELLYKNTEYAKEFLIEEGFAIEDELKYAEARIKKIRFLAQAVSNKKEDQKLFEAAYLLIKQAITENAQKTTEMLVALLQAKTPSVQYRKLENWSDEEIREVLADVDLVKLMEELEKK